MMLFLCFLVGMLLAHLIAWLFNLGEGGRLLLWAGITLLLFTAERLELWLRRPRRR